MMMTTQMNPAMIRLERQLVEAVSRALAGAHHVPIPEAGFLHWKWFNDLSATRSWHMAGPNPIGYLEIQSYSQLMGWEIRPQDVSIIMAMDRAYVQAASTERDHTRSGQPLTAEAFDAAFG